MDLLAILGTEGAPIALQVAALIYAYRALVVRVDKLETTVDAKLNNGIRSKLEDLHTSVARIEGKCYHCPSNSKNKQPH